ncbi:glutamate-5-semialdehyde dehydrogenase [Paenibacillus dokdonensis]|uniref:Gamma-glutamyl phosphate reductase n=1 Tax=Paenibacillus dokdonensis TaxID=2567944 RepID=A0ABU6GTZ8_9BACL|nr:glutamate-5-semialdehyde dehydrogenase [Paenibacillus dokdonensis]MEC0243226.1 glutamate-5-semialdehyde dehydrogenase [Paenibacillus dokdonensis]
MSEITMKAGKARSASAVLNRLSTNQKNDALQLMADSLRNHKDDIIAANQEDLERGRAQGTSPSLLDRLALNPQRIEAIAEGLEQIIMLPDPVGDVLDSFERPNGLQITKVRVPLGVIGIIYEARPNVTVDAAGLCLKAGNAVVLRGGSSALSSNRKIVEVLHSALSASPLPADAIQLIESADRSSVDEMLKLNGMLDVIIPRGGQSLIRNVVENATVPVIETGAGICHTYVDETAEPAMAEAIAVNAKVQRPSVCNSMETLLVNTRFAAAHLEHLADQLKNSGVEIRGCTETVKLIPWAVPAEEQDFATEYNDYILNIKLVDTLDEAMDHISRFSTKHSECIVTENTAIAERFLQEVDAAAVYHNASTRFTDGFEFGFGAEIGISTQKLHARGPMGLPALTSTKYIIHGNGQIRG